MITQSIVKVKLLTKRGKLQVLWEVLEAINLYPYIYRVHVVINNWFWLYTIMSVSLHYVHRSFPCPFKLDVTFLPTPWFFLANIVVKICYKKILVETFSFRVIYEFFPWPLSRTHNCVDHHAYNTSVSAAFLSVCR